MRSLKHVFIPRGTRGSSAIILSVIVSGSVLATIFYNQQSMQWALSSQADSKQKWSDHFIKKYGVTLGSYLVSNNLILCREDGWEESTADPRSPLCKWNNEHDESVNEDVKAPQDFNLTLLSPERVTKTQNGVATSAEILQFRARIQEEHINLGKALSFNITFDLVNMQDRAIKSLIGEIPDYVCRNKNTWQVIPNGYCRPPASGDRSTDTIFQDKCTQSATSNQAIPDSKCEFIAEVDQDHHIVLMSVQLLNDENIPKGERAYAGIRRPVAYWTMDLTKDPLCSLLCESSVTSNVHPGCRGNFQPDSQQSKTEFEMKITNQGPGTLYSLSLLRTDSYLNRDGAYNGREEFAITGDLLKRSGKKALLPGQSIKIEEWTDCRDIYRYDFESTTRRKNARRRSISTTTTVSENNQNRPFVSISYALGSLTTPPRICMKELTDGLLSPIDGDCSNRQNECGAGGHCLQPNMEPNRSPYLSTLAFTAQETQKSSIINTTTIIAVPPN